MKKYFILLISLLSINGLFCQDKKQITDVTLLIVKKIENFKYISLLYKGDDPYSRNKRMKSSDEQYKNYIALKTNASINELVTLSNHPNTNVRCYAFLILFEDSYSDLMSIIQDHVDDYGIVNLFINGMMVKQMVGDFFIRTAEPLFQSTDPLKKDLEELYENLFPPENQLKFKHNVLSTHRLTPELYPWLRSYIITNRPTMDRYYLNDLMDLLASYQQKKDIPIFKENIKYFHKNNTVGGYNAVKKFPEQVFMPFIILDLDKVPVKPIDRIPTRMWSDLYSATAAFKNNEAFELLRKSIEKSYDQEHLELIYRGIMEYYDDLYEDLLWDIWQENENLFLSGTGLEFLLEKDVKKTKIYLKKAIENSENNVNIQAVLDRVLVKEHNVGKELLEYLNQNSKNYSDSDYKKSDKIKRQEYFLIVYKKNEEFVNLINEGKTNINGGMENITHLEAACLSNNEEIVAFLLEKGAEIRYALNWCSLNKVNNTILDLLLENGADINRRNERGETILNQQVMALSGLYNIRRLDKERDIRNNTNTTSEIFDNQIKEREDFIKKLVVKGANPYLENSMGFDAFSRVQTETSNFLNKCIEEK